MIFPDGESVFGMCSIVKAVGEIFMESLMTRYPSDPLKAQQFPGYMSG